MTSQGIAALSDQVSGTKTGSNVTRSTSDSKRSIMIGDFLVRGTGGRFCGQQRDIRMVCCHPGARIKDISDRVLNILKGERNQQEFIVHIETNDTGREKDEILRREYRKFGRNLKRRSWRAVESGLLLVPRASE
eukprot:g34363.t1